MNALGWAGLGERYSLRAKKQGLEAIAWVLTIGMLEHCREAEISVPGVAVADTLIARPSVDPLRTFFAKVAILNSSQLAENLETNNIDRTINPLNIIVRT